MLKKIIALVPAAGRGARFGEALPKQYQDVNGLPMIYHSLAALARVKRIDKLVVILAPGDAHWQQFDWSALSGKLEVSHCGGETRAQSVSNALESLATVVAEDDWIMVHDAARPCIRAELIEQFLDELQRDAIGGLLALPLSDTVKEASPSLRVARTVPREGLWRAQTPQMFGFGMLREALRKMPHASDDAQAIEALGQSPKLVMGESANLKVTFAADMTLARLLLKGDKT